MSYRYDLYLVIYSSLLKERVSQEKVSKSGYFHVLLTKSCQGYYSLGRR